MFSISLTSASAPLLKPFSLGAHYWKLAFNRGHNSFLGFWFSQRERAVVIILCSHCQSPTIISPNNSTLKLPLKKKKKKKKHSLPGLSAIVHQHPHLSLTFLHGEASCSEVCAAISTRRQHVLVSVSRMGSNSTHISLTSKAQAWKLFFWLTFSLPLA